MSYSMLLLDFDHTLLDSDASEAASYDHTLRAFGVADPSQYFLAYAAINRSLWSQVEAGTIGPDDVRTVRFEKLAAHIGLDADPVAMGNTFVHGLGANGDLYPGARPILDQLAAGARLAMVTNGISEVQRARIERLDIGSYFEEIIVSAEVGASKPGSKIFDIAFDRLGHPPKAATVMIGDSLTSDIKGGANYGIATCWYNPDQQEASSADRIDHEVNTLAELGSLIR